VFKLGFKTQWRNDHAFGGMKKKAHNQLRQLLTFYGNAMERPLMERSPKKVLKLFCEEMALHLRMQNHVFYFVK